MRGDYGADDESASYFFIVFARLPEGSDLRLVGLLRQRSAPPHLGPLVISDEHRINISSRHVRHHVVEHPLLMWQIICRSQRAVSFFSGFFAIHFFGSLVFFRELLMQAGCSCPRRCRTHLRRWCGGLRAGRRPAGRRPLVVRPLGHEGKTWLACCTPSA